MGQEQEHAVAQGTEIKFWVKHDKWCAAAPQMGDCRHWTQHHRISPLVERHQRFSKVFNVAVPPPLQSLESLGISSSLHKMAPNDELMESNMDCS